MQYTTITKTRDKGDRYPHFKVQALKHDDRKCNASRLRCDCTCALCSRYKTVTGA